MVLNLRKWLKLLLPTRTSLKTALFVHPISVLMISFLSIIFVFNVGVNIFINYQAKNSIQAQYDRLDNYYIGDRGTVLESPSSLLGTTYIILNEQLVTQYRSTSVDDVDILRDSMNVLDYFYSHQDDWEILKDGEAVAEKLSVVLPKRISSGDSTYMVKLEKYQGILNHYHIIQGEEDSIYYVMVFVNITPLQEFVHRANILLLSIMLVVGVIAWAVIFLTSRKVDWSFATLKHYITSVGNREQDIKLPLLPYEEFNQVGDSVQVMSHMIESNHRSQKLFFQNASHELRTPLMSIQGYAEGIKEGIMKDPRQAAAIILEESQKMIQLVDEILNLSRMEMIQEELQCELIDLDDMLFQLGRRLQQQCKERGIVFQYDFSDDLEVRADGLLLEKAIGNILSNAVRYAKTRVTVAAENRDNCLIISLSNDGPPISNHDLPHIFERFYKGSDGNFGIGLSLAKDIMTRHGGHIRVTSDENETIFRLSLPH